jgi:phosphate starvation-inducible PhoH-like protein
MMMDCHAARVAAYIPPESPAATPAVTITAKTNNQRVALGYLNEGRRVVFLTGSAGTGKSMLACYRAASLLRSKKVEKVYLARPAVAVGKSIGLLPGEIEEKMAPYFKQTIAHLERFLGKGFTRYCLEKKVIEMIPAEYLRGMSFEDCFVLVEEAQNFTHDEMEMVLTRLGENCQLVFTGDEKQNDLKVSSGLKTTIDLINRTLQTHPEYMDHEDLDALDDEIGVVQFKPEDVVRSGLTRAFVKLYYHTS